MSDTTSSEQKSKKSRTDNTSKDVLVQDEPLGDNQVSRVLNLDSRHNPVHRVLTLQELLLVILSCLQELLEWDKIFTSQSYDAYRYRERDLAAAKSFLAVGFVNHFWREMFLRFSSSWAIIPATLASHESSLKGCLRLVGRSQVAITLRRMPDAHLAGEVAETVGTRLTSVRLHFPLIFQFHDFIERPEITTLFAHLTSLEVYATGPDVFDFRSISTLPAQLETLHLRNFLLESSCILPTTLRALTLDYTKQTGPMYGYSIHRDNDSGELISTDTLSALLATLGRLPLLEVLRVDIRYMAQHPRLSQSDLIELPNLKRLSVRISSPDVFMQFVGHISCPALESTRMAVDLSNGGLNNLRLCTVTSKLLQLVQKGSHPVPGQSDRIDFGHVYIDERGDMLPRSGRPRAQWQSTVALAPRDDFVPLDDPYLLTDRIASTAVVAITVDYYWWRERNSIPEIKSRVVNDILSGLPDLDVASLSVHCRPCFVGNANSSTILPYDHVAFMTHVSSARQLYWLGNEKQLADSLAKPELLLQLEYLAVRPLKDALMSTALKVALNGRKQRVQASVKTLLFSSQTVQNVARMFNIFQQNLLTT